MKQGNTPQEIDAEDQQARRAERRPRYLRYAIERGITWRWLNEPYAIRFGPDDNFVDFYVTHAMVAFRGKDGRQIWKRGFDALEKALIEHGLIAEEVKINEN